MITMRSPTNRSTPPEGFIDLKGIKPDLFNFSAFRKKYRMKVLKNNLSFNYRRNFRHLLQACYLCRLKIIAVMSITIRSKMKTIVIRSQVTPKLLNGLEDPSLSSPTFCSVDEDSLGGNPKNSIMVAEKSRSSVISPSAIFFNSYNKNWTVLG